MATILLVEDEPLIRSLYLTVLKQCSYELLSAAEEQEALGIIRRKLPELILLDLLIPSLKTPDVPEPFHNPVGFNILREVQVLRKRARAGHKLRVVVLSNLDSDEHRARARELGAEDYWVKSALNPRELPERLQALLG